MVKVCDRVIEAGILFLIVFTPLMFGSVHVRNYCVLAILAFALVLIWMTKMFLTGRYEFKRTPMDWFLMALVALVLFQLVPLPPKVVMIQPGEKQRHREGKRKRGHRNGT